MTIKMQSSNLRKLEVLLSGLNNEFPRNGSIFENCIEQTRTIVSDELSRRAAERAEQDYYHEA